MQQALPASHTGNFRRKGRPDMTDFACSRKTRLEVSAQKFTSLQHRSLPNSWTSNPFQPQSKRINAPRCVAQTTPNNLGNAEPPPTHDSPFRSKHPTFSHDLQLFQGCGFPTERVITKDLSTQAPTPARAGAIDGYERRDRES